MELNLAELAVDVGSNVRTAKASEDLHILLIYHKQGGSPLQKVVDLASRCEVYAFYWSAQAPEIVNSGREEQGSASV